MFDVADRKSAGKTQFYQIKRRETDKEGMASLLEPRGPKSPPRAFQFQAEIVYVLIGSILGLTNDLLEKKFKPCTTE